MRHVHILVTGGCNQPPLPTLHLLRLWYVSMAECVHVMTGHTAAVNAVVLATDGTKTISGSADSTIKVWNTDINSR